MKASEKTAMQIQLDAIRNRISQLKDYIKCSKDDEKTLNQYRRIKIEVLQVVELNLIMGLKLEKQQIFDSYDDGHSNPNVSAEEYFNTKYGKDESI